MASAQRRFENASRNRKSCKTKLERAQASHDDANKEYEEWAKKEMRR